MRTVDEVVTAIDTAKGFATTNVTPTGTAHAGYGCEAIGLLISVNAQSGISLRFDGGTPSASVGHPLASGDFLYLGGKEKVLNFKFVSTGATTATIRGSIDYGPKQ
jgi:hypothetical protein